MVVGRNPSKKNDVYTSLPMRTINEPVVDFVKTKKAATRPVITTFAIKKDKKEKMIKKKKRSEKKKKLGF